MYSCTVRIVSFGIFMIKGNITHEPCIDADLEVRMESQVR